MKTLKSKEFSPGVGSQTTVPIKSIIELKTNANGLQLEIDPLYNMK